MSFAERIHQALAAGHFYYRVIQDDRDESGLKDHSDEQQAWLAEHANAKAKRGWNFDPEDSDLLQRPKTPPEKSNDERPDGGSSADNA